MDGTVLFDPTKLCRNSALVTPPSSCSSGEFLEISVGCSTNHGSIDIRPNQGMQLTRDRTYETPKENARKVDLPDNAISEPTMQLVSRSVPIINYIAR